MFLQQVSAELAGGAAAEQLPAGCTHAATTDATQEPQQAKPTTAGNTSPMGSGEGPMGLRWEVSAGLTAQGHAWGSQGAAN